MSIGYSIHEIAKITGGELIRSGSGETIYHILTDSRKIAFPTHSLFIAIKGERHDGNSFIREAYKAGVRIFIAESRTGIPAFEDISVIIVKSGIAALQKLAAHHRSLFDIPVIGITGSNGKTIVKEWLNLLLSDDYVIARSPRSYNSQLGVPLSVLTLSTEHSFGIFEAGISMPGEMDRLRQVISPSLGVFTNIGDAHQENFSGKEEKAIEKIKLFRNCKTLVFPAHYPEIIEAVKTLPDSVRRIGWSFTARPDAALVVASSIKNSSDIHVFWNGNEEQFQVNLTGNAAIENATTCIITLLSLGYASHQIQERLDRLVSLSMRLELLNGVNQCVLVNDVYSNDLHSLEIALDFLRQNSPGLHRTIILSDIHQSGLTSEELYTKVNVLLEGMKVDELIGVGPEINKCVHLFSMPSHFYKEVSTLLSSGLLGELSKRAILIKGARSFRFEEITEFLQEKTHDTVFEINLNALSHNLNYFKSKLKPSTRLMVMVKASGYGSGSHEIAALLEFNKVDYLAVAYTDEGVSLRKAGVSLPIMVMNPDQSSLNALIRHKLEPEIFSFKSLHTFKRALQDHSSEKTYPIHIKIDSGMHRLGFGWEDMKPLMQELMESPNLHVQSVFTHLAATENPEHDAFTAGQLELFDKCCEMLSQNIDRSFLKHALNTGGIQRFDGAQYDMVRLGIGLYGISSHSDEQPHLMPVSTLKTVVSQIKKIHSGESVGYGRRFIAPHDSIIATIPLGYADGMSRSLSNGIGKVMIHGQLAPIVGSVCMDMTMVDITNIPCAEGDPVEIFGKNLSINDFSAWCGTIPYEVLTSIGQRVKRVYIQE